MEEAIWLDTGQGREGISGRDGVGWRGGDTEWGQGQVSSGGREGVPSTGPAVVVERLGHGSAGGGAGSLGSPVGLPHCTARRCWVREASGEGRPVWPQDRAGEEPKA